MNFFHHSKPEFRRPKAAAIPELPNVHFFALYRGARTGGDFYDFCEVDGRVLLLFCDISGERDQAFNIAASVQDLFHTRAAELFCGRDINESERLSELMLDVNREILEVSGAPRHTPAFVSCLDPELGTLTYINAGHLPALLRDQDGVSTLDANGLPLGLFSHSTHDAKLSVVRPGSSLLLVSRGLVETKRHHEEFGMERVKESLLQANYADARTLCSAMHNAADRFLDNARPDNDLTTVAVVRSQEMGLAASA